MHSTKIPTFCKKCNHKKIEIFSILKLRVIKKKKLQKPCLKKGNGRQASTNIFKVLKKANEITHVDI